MRGIDVESIASATEYAYVDCCREQGGQLDVEMAAGFKLNSTSDWPLYP